MNTKPWTFAHTQKRGTSQKMRAPRGLRLSAWEALGQHHGDQSERHRRRANEQPGVDRGDRERADRHGKVRFAGPGLAQQGRDGDRQERAEHLQAQGAEPPHDSEEKHVAHVLDVLDGARGEGESSIRRSVRCATTSRPTAR